MAWYTTGTIAVSGTTVTGTGTNFLDNTQSIGPGQALLIPGSGTVKMYEVASVQSATKLTLKTSAGTVAAGQAYAILSFYTDSVPDFARRLAAQLSYYQSQMDGWQQIMTGTGSITMTAPDGTTVTISSFSKLTSDIANALQQRGRPTAFTDVNNIGPDANGLGIWNFQASADYNMANLPEVYPGVLEVFAAGNNAGTQRYTTARGTVYVRAPSATWNASAPAWNEWFCVSMATNSTSMAVDLNTLTQAGRYTISSGTGSANLPIASTGVLEVTRYGASATLVQQLFKTQSVTASVVNRIFTRVLHNAGNWSSWAESLTTNSFGTAAGTAAQGNDSRLNTIDGKSGGNVSSGIIVTGGVNLKKTVSSEISQSSEMVYSTIVTGTTERARIGMDIGTSAAGERVGRIYVGQDGTNKVWTYVYSTGSATAPGQWINGSDERFKTNIQEIEDPLTKMRAIKGCTWERLDFDAKGIGFIAQDVLKVFPDSVYDNFAPVTLKDGTVLENTYSLDTSGVAAALHHQAILALMDKVDELEKRDTEKNEVIAELLKRMKAIDGLDE